MSGITVQINSNEFTRVVRNLDFSSGDLDVTIVVTREDLEHLHAVAEAALAAWSS